MAYQSDLSGVTGNFNVAGSLTIDGGKTISATKDISIILSSAGVALTAAVLDYGWVASEGGTFTDFLLTVGTAPTGAAIDFDIKKNGTTIFTTRITIDATETSSDTAATPFTLSTTTFARGDRLSFEFVAVGSTIAGADAQLTIYYLKT